MPLDVPGWLLRNPLWEKQRYWTWQWQQRRCLQKQQPNLGPWSPRAVAARAVSWFWQLARTMGGQVQCCRWTLRFFPKSHKTVSSYKTSGELTEQPTGPLPWGLEADQIVQEKPNRQEPSAANLLPLPVMRLCQIPMGHPGVPLMRECLKAGAWTQCGGECRPPDSAETTCDCNLACPLLHVVPPTGWVSSQPMLCPTAFSTAAT